MTLENAADLVVLDLYGCFFTWSGDWEQKQLIRLTAPSESVNQQSRRQNKAERKMLYLLGVSIMAEVNITAMWTEVIIYSIVFLYNLVLIVAIQQFTYYYLAAVIYFEKELIYLLQFFKSFLALWFSIQYQFQSYLCFFLFVVHVLKPAGNVVIFRLFSYLQILWMSIHPFFV